MLIFSNLNSFYLGGRPRDSTLPSGSMATPRIPKFLTLIGLALVVAGIAFKLNHLMGAEPVFNAGAVVLIAGLVSWAVAVVRQQKQ